MAKTTDKVLVKRPQDTLAKGISKYAILETLQSIYDGSKYGGGKLPPETIVAMMAREGRADIGANNPDLTQRRNKELYDKLMVAGNTSPKVPINIAEKQATEKRTGIPFFKLWTGTGKARDEKGRVINSGEEYNEAMNTIYKNAHLDPKNKDLYELTKRILSGGITPEEEAWLRPEQARDRALESIGKPYPKEAERRSALANPDDMDAMTRTYNAVIKNYYPELKGTSLSPDKYAKVLADAILQKQGIEIPDFDETASIRRNNPELDKKVEETLTKREKKEEPSTIDALISKFKELVGYKDD